MICTKTIADRKRHKPKLQVSEQLALRYQVDKFFQSTILLSLAEPFQYLAIEVRQLLPELRLLRLDKLHERLQAPWTQIPIPVIRQPSMIICLAPSTHMNGVTKNVGSAGAAIFL